jgi:hypothetical protein
LDVFVHDKQTGITQRVSIASDSSQGTGGSNQSSITADGRYVVFSSCASNLVSGDTNDFIHTFLHDRQLNITELVSLTFDGIQGNNHSRNGPISANGRYVSYWSYANNLVLGDDNGVADVFLDDQEGRNFLSHLPGIHFQP